MLSNLLELVKLGPMETDRFVLHDTVVRDRSGFGVSDARLSAAAS